MRCIALCVQIGCVARRMERKEEEEHLWDHQPENMLVF